MAKFRSSLGILVLAQYGPGENDVSVRQVGGVAPARANLGRASARRSRGALNEQDITVPQVMRIKLGGRMSDTTSDSDLGTLIWDDRLSWWKGSIRLSSEVPFDLYIFARSDKTSERTITVEARCAVDRVRHHEPACRRYAAEALLEIHNSRWSERDVISADEFMLRLAPGSVEIHETGYAEIHFGDGGLFRGHSVGVRIRSDGSFQEAVIEG